jgi:hypothetical protein
MLGIGGPRDFSFDEARGKTIRVSGDVRGVPNSRRVSVRVGRSFNPKPKRKSRKGGR